MTAHDLAERAETTRTILRRIEAGNPKCQIGLVLEVAALAGVTLFNTDSGLGLERLKVHVDDTLALLPKTMRPRNVDVFDDF